MTSTGQECIYDVVIIGSGIAGALLAKELGKKNKNVLVLEAGDEVKPNNNAYLMRYYEAASKVPEAPYTPEIFSDASDGSKDVRKFAVGRSSDAKLVKPSQVNAGRPTVLSVSSRAWAAPNGEWLADKCDPSSEDNYFVQAGELPFASTYERIAGGTARHWMGICLRHLPNDFRMAEVYGSIPGGEDRWPNWPSGCRYDDLLPWYDSAEREIGVSGDADVQRKFERRFGGTASFGYPMPAIPLSYGDKVLNRQLHEKSVEFNIADGKSVPLEVTPIPAARNSEPFNRRRACAGNSSCIPICPIQAKYDPTITLREALGTGKVTIWYRTVASNIVIRDPSLKSGDNEVTQIDFISYFQDIGGKSKRGRVRARAYVIAGNAIETPRLMLMSNDRKGITRPHRPVGNYLMDHPFYIAPALTPKGQEVYPYRGPLVTGGIEVLRDGSFRNQHATFRVDVSNMGWSLTEKGRVHTLVEDFVTGSNQSLQNCGKEILAGKGLVEKLRDLISRQVSLGFLVEQSPDRANRVTISPRFPGERADGLELPRPIIHYNLSNYTKDGLVRAKKLAAHIYNELGWTPLDDRPEATSCSDAAPHQKVPDALSFTHGDPDNRKEIVDIHFMGAGHIAGTCRMGERSEDDCVVNSDLRCWDHRNLYILGSSVFPTLGTANPTLTIAALALRLGEHLCVQLDSQAFGAGSKPTYETTG